MTRLLCSLVILIWMVLVPTRAQEPLYRIHDHPEKAQYNSSGEFVPFEPQVHFLDSNFGGMLAHEHPLCHCPLDAEITGPFTVRLENKLFMTSGQLDPNGFLIPGATKIVFDDSGTSLPLNRRGNPTGLKTDWATVTIDPWAAGWPLHGWVAQMFRVAVFFDDGSFGVVEGYWSFYSMLDPTAPETNVSPSPYGHFMGVRAIYHPSSGENLATQAEEYRTRLPLVPMTGTWCGVRANYTYGSSSQGQLAPGRTLDRLDARLHDGVPGTVTFDQTVSSTNPDPGSGPFFDEQNPFCLDPSQFADGPHTLLTGWEQPTRSDIATVFQPGIESWALVTIPFTANAGGTPPPPDPCITDPLQASVSVVGINHPVVIWTGVVTAKDDRSCTTTISR